LATKGLSRDGHLSKIAYLLERTSPWVIARISDREPSVELAA
jgi:hypothetical protein